MGTGAAVFTDGARVDVYDGAWDDSRDGPRDAEGTCHDDVDDMCVFDLLSAAGPEG